MEAEIMVKSSPPLVGLVDEERMRAAAAHVLESEGRRESASLTLVVVDDGDMRRLNLRHRNVDATTDVLSFPAGSLPPGVADDEVRGYLGDVVVSYPRAVVQAAQHMVPLAHEIDLLVVHGVLHLLGYEDDTEQGRETMWERQETLCQEILDLYPVDEPEREP